MNTLKIESAYFINKSNAQTIAQKVLDYYQKTYKTEFEFIVEEESLTQDVAIESNSFSRQLVGHIKKLDINLTGGFTANAEINARVRLLTVLRQVDLNENYASMLVRNVYIKEEVSNG